MASTTRDETAEGGGGGGGGEGSVVHLQVTSDDGVSDDASSKQNVSYATAASGSSPTSSSSSATPSTAYRAGAAAGSKSPRRKSPSPSRHAEKKQHKGFKLRVGQFNLLNMAKAGVDFYPNERYTQDEVDSKVQWTASQLKKMNAGLVGFEELIHEEVLLDAIKKSGLPKGLHFCCCACVKVLHIIHLEGELVSYPTGYPGVALYSIYKVVESESIVDFPPEAILTVNSCQMPITKFSRPGIAWWR